MDRRNLSLMLIVFGLVELSIPLVHFFLVLPQLYKLDQSLNSNSFSPVLSFGFFGLAIVVSLLQIIRGIFFRESDTKTSIRLLVAGGILGLLTLPMIIITTYIPISQISGN